NQLTNSVTNTLPEYTCGPTSMGMILHYHNIIESVNSFVTHCNQEIMQGNYAVNTKALDFVQRIGLTAELVDNPADLHRLLEPDSLRAIFEANKLLYLSYESSISPEGHIVVAHGIEGDYIQVTDPLGGSRKRLHYY